MCFFQDLLFSISVLFPDFQGIVVCILDDEDGVSDARRCSCEESNMIPNPVLARSLLDR